MTFFAYFCRAKVGDYINKVGKGTNAEILITHLANAGNI